MSARQAGNRERACSQIGTDTATTRVNHGTVVRIGWLHRRTETHRARVNSIWANRTRIRRDTRTHELMFGSQLHVVLMETTGKCCK